MNLMQQWIEAAVGYSIDWDATAGWAQFFGALIALFVALWFGWAQLAHSWRVESRSTAAYFTGAIAAVEHAEAAMNEAVRMAKGGALVARDQIAMSPAIHMLEAAEAALASLPLHLAPTPETARALVAAQFQVRRVSGNLRNFLADPNNSGMRTSFKDEEGELAHAAINLRAEAKRR